MRPVRKIVSVKPQARKKSIEHLRDRLLEVTTAAEADEVIKYDGFVVTLACGHSERWINRPRRTEDRCHQCPEIEPELKLI